MDARTDIGHGGQDTNVPFFPVHGDDGYSVRYLTSVYLTPKESEIMNDFLKVENSIRICRDIPGILLKEQADLHTTEKEIERVVVIVNGRTYDMIPEIFFTMVEEYMEE